MDFGDEARTTAVASEENDAHPLYADESIPRTGSSDAAEFLGDSP
jgi:hypothetical protein